MPLVSKVDRMAICLVGGARSFELTGLSVKDNLLSAYPNSDVFVNMPIDENSHKLTILQGVRNIVAMRVFAQGPMKEDRTTELVLTAHGSPNAVQGCTRLIRDHERRHNMEYKWVLRTRVDGFWNGKPPPLSALDERKYTIPHGSDYNGLNDRLGVGTHKLSEAALRRLSVLPLLRNRGFRELNSESSFKAQLLIQNITVGRADFPFCILSHRQYMWPLARWAVPVVSINSRGALNGAKCRPCHPAATGNETQRQLAAVDPIWGAIGAGLQVDLCNAEGPWEENWDTLFDRSAGPKAAFIRKSIVSRPFKQCVTENAALQDSVTRYRGPPPVVLCLIGRWGYMQQVGAPGSQWPIYFKGLHAKSVIYSVGMGRNLTWEAEMITKGGFLVHVFDSTPHGVRWAKQRLGARISPRIHLHDWCIAGGADGEYRVNALAWPTQPPGIYTALTVHPDGYVFVAPPLAVPGKRLDTTMHELKHAKVDILKVDIAGGEFELINEWDARQADLPVCQLLLRFGTRWAGHQGEYLRHRALEALHRLGFFLLKCLGTPADERCIFLSSKHCVVVQ
eukprot:jgi/Mesen1/8747/ME000052S08172